MARSARRLDVLQRAEHEFDPIPFSAEAAKTYGRVTAAVVSPGRKPRRRIADLMIAATAIAEDLPLFTTNLDEFEGLLGLLNGAPVTRPPVPSARRWPRSWYSPLRRLAIPGGPGKTAGPAEFASLMDDLEKRIFGTLPDETWVYPGHGDDTTLGKERPSIPEWRARGW